jgi:hypothetical protein
MRKFLVGAATAVLCVTAATAIADRNAGNTKVSLKNKEVSIFEGHVTAKAAACEKRRVVSVYHDENNDASPMGDFEIGSDVTSNAGLYVISGNQPEAGDQVLAEVGPRDAGDIRCKRAKVTAIALSG